MSQLRSVYLDHAATTPPHPAVVEAMLPYLGTGYGNPSSIYRLGREAREAVERARQTVAGILGASPEEIVFTSGGTEADNQAIKGVALYNPALKNHIITSSIEHHAVLESCGYLERKGFDVTYLPVSREGWVDPDQVRKALRRRTCLVSIMHANNEVGTIEPIELISPITREAGIPLHVDAVQTAGILELDVNRLGVDLLAISGHKLYGPKGTGCLYMRTGTELDSFMHGGAQERRRRAGTENVAGIVGFARALELAAEGREERVARLTRLRDRLTRGILEAVEDAALSGHPSLRLPGNVHVRVRYIEGEALCLHLDLAGIAASTGSACSSESGEPSHVLSAMGVPPDEARGSLRLTLGNENTEEDVDYVLEQIVSVVERLRQISPIGRRN